MKTHYNDEFIKIVDKNGTLDAKIAEHDSIKDWLQGAECDAEIAIIVETVKVNALRKGTGSKLMQAIIGEAKYQGADTILLNASPMFQCMPLESLIKFYEGFGFNVIAQEECNAIMSLQLSA